MDEAKEVAEHREGVALVRFQVAVADYVTGFLSFDRLIEEANIAQRAFPDYVVAALQRFKMSKSAPTPPAPAPVGAEVEELVKALEAAAWACKLGYQLLEITGLDSKDRIEAHKKMFDAHCDGVAALSKYEASRG